MRETRQSTPRLPSAPAPAAASPAVATPVVAALPEAAPELTLAEQLEQAEKTAETHVAAVKKQEEELIGLYSVRGRILALLDDLGRKVDKQERERIHEALEEHSDAFDAVIDSKLKLKGLRENYERMGRIAARGRKAASTDPAAAQLELDKCGVLFLDTSRNHSTLTRDSASAVKELEEARPKLKRIEAWLRKLEE